VAIARALAGKPALLLADEPTGALDTNTGKEILALFRELNQEGVTVVVVTHDLEVAADAKRTIEMRDGKIIRDQKNGARAA
jgi:putative ABC transport system ATP-binding protein